MACEARARRWRQTLCAGPDSGRTRFHRESQAQGLNKSKQIVDELSKTINELSRDAIESVEETNRVGNLSEKEFKVMIVKMIQNIIKRMEAQTEKIKKKFNN